MGNQMTVEQLKSHAYDCIANKEMWEKELQATNQLILQKAQEQKKLEESKKEENKKETNETSTVPS